jgi:hypothetical protein
MKKGDRQASKKALLATSMSYKRPGNSQSSNPYNLLRHKIVAYLAQGDRMIFVNKWPKM